MSNTPETSCFLHRQ